jgi:hypothetical protein
VARREIPGRSIALVAAGVAALLMHQAPAVPAAPATGVHAAMGRTDDGARERRLYTEQLLHERAAESP